MRTVETSYLDSYVHDGKLFLDTWYAVEGHKEVTFSVDLKRVNFIHISDAGPQIEFFMNSGKVFTFKEEMVDSDVFERIANNLAEIGEKGLFNLHTFGTPESVDGSDWHIVNVSAITEWKKFLDTVDGETFEVVGVTFSNGNYILFDTYNAGYDGIRAFVNLLETGNNVVPTVNPFENVAFANAG